MKGRRSRQSWKIGEESAVRWTFRLFSIFALVWVLTMFGTSLMHHGIGPGYFTEASTVVPTISSVEPPYNSYLWTE